MNDLIFGYLVVNKTALSRRSQLVFGLSFSLWRNSSLGPFQSTKPKDKNNNRWTLYLILQTFLQAKPTHQLLHRRCTKIISKLSYLFQTSVIPNNKFPISWQFKSNNTSYPTFFANFPYSDVARGG